jgi:hypothetical protein
MEIWVIGIAASVIGGVILDLLGYTPRFLRRLMRRPVVEIFHPVEGERVGLHETVRGTIQPPGPLQVLVLSNDGEWYRQADPQLIGVAWSVQCTFGTESSRSDRSYEIIAIAGKAVRANSVAKLPRRGAKSRRVRVWRAPQD